MKITITAKHLLKQKTELSIVDSFMAVGLRRVDDRIVVELGYRPDNTMMFHVPSIIDYKAVGEVYSERFHGIIAVFDNGIRPEFMDIIQVTSIDRMSHPHSPSFVRGDPWHAYVVMCLGGYGQIFRRVLHAQEYIVLAHLLVQCVSQLNEESMFSSIPRKKKCVSCGNETYQNIITVLSDRRTICSECDYVFGEDRYDSRVLRTAANSRHVDPRQPIWTPIDWRQSDGAHHITDQH